MIKKLTQRHILPIEIRKKISGSLCWSFVLLSMLCFTLESAFAQDKLIEVKAKIVDQTQLSVIGANVIEIGTTNGTITDVDGNFSYRFKENAKIRISFIGYKSIEFTVGESIPSVIVMEEDVTKIDEVVVVGYGTMRRKDVTGAVSQVKVDKPEYAMNTSIMQALQGSVAGLNVAATTGAGESPSFSIRGSNSLSTSNSPLIVVDGIIYNGSVSDISPNSIESVEVLKDASSAAVYGSRSANGVVLITTKVGRVSKPKISFNVIAGVNVPTNKPKMKDGAGYIQKILDYRKANGQEADPSKIINYLQPDEVENYKAGRTVDTYDLMVDPGFTQNYDVSLDGGAKGIRYFVSANYTNEKGVVYGDRFKRYGVRSNLDTDITDWLTVGLRASYTKSDYSGASADLMVAQYMSPYARLYEDDGSYVRYPMTDQLAPNPFLEPNEREEMDLRSSLLGVGYIQIKFPFLEGLKYRVNASHNIRNNQSGQFWGLNTMQGEKSNGRGNRYESEGISQLLDNILSYENTFGKHYVNATLLYSYEHNEAKSLSGSATNFGTDVLGWNNLQSGQTQTVSTSHWDDNSISQMGRFHYGYDDRYMITFTVRRDGYSGFGKDHKFGVFPSAAFAWSISQEKFMKDIDWIGNLKLRLSYGRNGNQAISRYQSLARVGFGKYVYGENSVTSIYPTSMANENLKWESTVTTNYGLDMSFLKNRLSAVIDIYTSESKDLLLRQSIPYMTGFSSVWSNIGKVKNWGIEATISSENIVKGDFKWSSSAVFSLNRNKIVSLYGVDNNKDGREDDDRANNWFIGESIGAIYGYQANGIWQTGDVIPKGFKPGFFKIVDTDGKEGISPDDRHVYANSSPNFRWSLQNTFTYKGITFSFMLNSIMGGNGYYMMDNYSALNPNTYFPGRQNIVDIPYWTPENPSNDYPVINYSPPYKHAFLQDRSFVRLRDVTLAYDLPERITEKMGLNKLRVYASGRNLYTWTKWTGYDPETGQSIWGGSPSMATYLFGINLSF